MAAVSFVRYSPEQSDPSITHQLVECYRAVFATAPWHEWLKCPVCSRYWGIKDQELLSLSGFRHCGVPLVDFWSREQVVSDLHHEITPQASCWLALDGTTVVGFCWGYPLTVAALQAKLGIAFGGEIPRENDDSVVAYQDEVGVLAAYRGRKIAKAMVALRHEDFVAQGLRFGVVRTRQSPEPSLTFLWYTQKLDYKILATYPGEDGRVVLGRRLVGLG